MIVTVLHGVWKSTDDFKLDREPVAVCATEAAAWAVFNLLNPPLVNGCSTGPYPVKDFFYVYNTRPDLAEDTRPRPLATDCGREDADDAREAAAETRAYLQRSLGYYA